MRHILFNGSDPVTMDVERNGYKPRVTLSNGSSEISFELDSDAEEAFLEILDHESVQDLEAEIEKLEEEVDELRDNKKELEEEIEDLKNKIEELGDQLDDCGG